MFESIPGFEDAKRLQRMWLMLEAFKKSTGTGEGLTFNVSDEGITLNVDLPRISVVQVVNATPRSDGRFDAQVVYFDENQENYIVTVPIWLRDANFQSLQNNHYYLALGTGYSDDQFDAQDGRTVYTTFCCSGDATTINNLTTRINNLELRLAICCPQSSSSMAPVFSSSSSSQQSSLSSAANPCCIGPSMTATFPPGQGCPCLDNATITLNDAGGGWFTGSLGICSDTMTLMFFCGATCDQCLLTANFGTHGVVGPISPVAGCTCHPLNVHFTGLNFPNLGIQCDGAVNVVITSLFGFHNDWMNEWYKQPTSTSMQSSKSLHYDH